MCAPDPFFRGADGFAGRRGKFFSRLLGARPEQRPDGFPGPAETGGRPDSPPRFRFIRSAALLVFVVLAGFAFSDAFPAYAESQFLPVSEEFSGSRDFRGLINRDMAMRAARVAADLAALEYAARIVAREPDVRFTAGTAGPAGSGGPAGPDGTRAASAPRSLPIDGIARMLFQTRSSAQGIQGFPPKVQAVAHVRLYEPAPLRPDLQAALRRADLMELYGMVVARQRVLLARYDVLAASLLDIQPHTEGQEEVHAVRRLLNEWDALDLYAEVLPLYGENWRTPQKAREILEKALELAPAEPLALTALAEVFLQLDKPVEALDRVGDALTHAPGFARAHDLKGTILLRQRLPALAVASFSRAIALAPDNAAYYLHRAAALMVQEEKSAMCGDFHAACALGDCEAQQWAVRSGQCGPAPAVSPAMEPRRAAASADSSLLSAPTGTAPPPAIPVPGEMTPDGHTSFPANAEPPGQSTPGQSVPPASHGGGRP